LNNARVTYKALLEIRAKSAVPKIIEPVIVEDIPIVTEAEEI